MKIIIGANEDETRMGIIEDGRLAEYVVERAGGRCLVGSIFKGRVASVARGIRAAFIDLGLEQNAFLRLGEKSGVTEGQSLLVQVTKDARGGKGPTVSRELALAGRYLVLLPGGGRICVSRKIADKDERVRLSALGTEIAPAGTGLVLRTAAQGADRAYLECELRALEASWRVIEARSRAAKSPCMLFREFDLPVRAVRDYLGPDLEEIIFDNPAVLGRVKELMDGFPEGGGVRLALRNDPEDVFASCGLAEDIAALSQRKAGLRSGGYIVIDHAEAMTVIDVNSGSFRGRESQEETAFAINREAAWEIARQLRLRDIGGIIVVDFIDMDLKEHRDKIMGELSLAMQGDRQRPKVQDMTALNLVEITRKKARRNLSASLCEECPACCGSGRVRSRETLSLDIKARLRAVSAAKGHSGTFDLVLNPWLADFIGAKRMRSWERELGCSVRVERDPSLNLESFALLERGGA